MDFYFWPLYTSSAATNYVSLFHGGFGYVDCDCGELCRRCTGDFAWTDFAYEQTGNSHIYIYMPGDGNLVLCVYIYIYIYIYIMPGNENALTLRRKHTTKSRVQAPRMQPRRLSARRPSARRPCSACPSCNRIDISWAPVDVKWLCFDMGISRLSRCRDLVVIPLCKRRGPIGTMGPWGPRGPWGQWGPLGPWGPMGPKGPLGLMGPMGPNGAHGPPGAHGAHGTQGAQGPHGPKGEKVNPRPTGSIPGRNWGGCPGLGGSPANRFNPRPIGSIPGQIPGRAWGRWSWQAALTKASNSHLDLGFGPCARTGSGHGFTKWRPNFTHKLRHYIASKSTMKHPKWEKTIISVCLNRRQTYSQKKKNKTRHRVRLHFYWSKRSSPNFKYHILSRNTFFTVPNDPQQKSTLK